MQSNKISPREISLAVEVVRNLENVLRQASRKRKLTTEQRQKLLKCANHLKRQRKAATKDKVVLPKAFWIGILKCLFWIVGNGKRIKHIFGELMG